MAGGTGIDTYNDIGKIGNSVIMSGSNDLSANGAFAATVVIATGDTFTFATTAAGNVDVISDFAATDLIDATTAAAAPTSGLAANDTDLVAGTGYVIYGNYVVATGVFTVAAAFNATNAPDAVYVEGDAGTTTFLTTTGYVVLTGLTAALAAGNFI
jgi:hypothetical protein